VFHCVGLTYRRYVIKPTGLDNRRESDYSAVVSGRLGGGFVEGARIGGTGWDRIGLGHVVAVSGDCRGVRWPWCRRAQFCSGIGCGGGRTWSSPFGF
jgi:hypothetical protein